MRIREKELNAKKISVSMEAGVREPMIHADAKQIKEVFSKVIGNALDVVGENSTIRIITGIDDHYVFAKIVDQGTGIKKEDISRVFEPYFTTKKTGTGLGLPIVSKIFERVIFKTVYNFFHDHDLLTSNQSGFRPKDGTVNQLAYLYHVFSQALDMKKDIRIVFCDVTKAFDRVGHKGLLFKLESLGVTGSLLQFFKDYLSNRQQRVLVTKRGKVTLAVKASRSMFSNVANF